MRKTQGRNCAHLGERANKEGIREAGELGFEPRLTESESVVLPLHHSPKEHDSKRRKPLAFANECYALRYAARSDRSIPRRFGSVHESRRRDAANGGGSFVI